MKFEISTVIFDLDGTLVDTEPAAARAIEECFGEWGLAIAEKDAQFITGRTWATAFEYLFSRYRIPVARSEASQRMMSVYREALKSELKQVPGGADAVRALRSDGGYRLGLVSGSSRAEIAFCLDRLGLTGEFELVLGCEDYPCSKPAPDGFAKAIRELGAEPRRTLVFEDSEAGIASARAAGAWVVAIQSTNHFKQDTSQAHLKISDLRGVDAKWVGALRLK